MQLHDAFLSTIGFTGSSSLPSSRIGVGTSYHVRAHHTQAHRCSCHTLHKSTYLVLYGCLFMFCTLHQRPHTRRPSMCTLPSHIRERWNRTRAENPPSPPPPCASLSRTHHTRSLISALGLATLQWSLGARVELPGHSSLHGWCACLLDAPPAIRGALEQGRAYEFLAQPGVEKVSSFGIGILEPHRKTGTAEPDTAIVEWTPWDGRGLELLKQELCK